MSLIKSGVRFFERLTQKPKTQQKKEKTKPKFTIADISIKMPTETNTSKATRSISDRTIQSQQPTISIKDEENQLDPRIKWLRENSTVWKEMDNRLLEKDGSISESGFQEIIKKLETLDLGNKDECQKLALYAADKYQTQQFDHDKMTTFMDTFMACYVEAIAKEQTDKAMSEINSKSYIPSLVLTAELIILSQNRTTKETSHALNIKIYVPVAISGWEELDHQKHANKIDELFAEKMANKIQTKCRHFKGSETQRKKLKEEINNQTITHLKKKLYEQGKKISDTIASGEPTIKIRKRIKNEVIERRNDLISALRDAEIEIPQKNRKS